MTIKAELTYLDFHNAKENLATGYYRIIESDGEVSIAKVVEWSDNRTPTVTWCTEAEYQELSSLDQQLSDSWDSKHTVTDRKDQTECVSHHDYLKPVCNTTLADLLQSALQIDPRDMSKEEYAELCELAAQNRKDHV